MTQLKYALVFTAGLAIGLGMAVYLALNVLQIDVIMPGPSGIWWA